MPGRVHDRDSWLYQARVRAGFKARPSFAQRLGVSTDTVSLWELGKHYPPWQFICKIADVLNVPVREAAEALWKEKVGDLCPCCGGVKILPDEAEALVLEGKAVFVDADAARLLHARMMPIKLPCENCGKIRIHLHRKTRGHPKLCQSCSRLEEAKPFRCAGYKLPNFDTPQYAKHCPRIIHLKPWQIQKKQRWAKDNPSSFFDLASRSYRCGGCTKAAFPMRNRLKRLRELEAKESGQRRLSSVPPRTREQLNKLFRKHRDNPDLYRSEDEEGSELLRRGLYPLNPVPQSAQEKGRQTYAERCKTGKKWPKMTEGCMLRRWGRRCDQPLCKGHDPHPGVKCSRCSCLKYLPRELPRNVRFGICVWCWNRDAQGTLIIRKNSANIKLRFHDPCYGEWRKNTDDGKRFLALKRRGEEASLPSYKPGRRPEERDLKLRWSWFWQHCAGKISYDEVAREHRLVPSAVQKAVEFMIDHLPESRFVDTRYQPMVELAKMLSHASK